MGALMARKDLLKGLLDPGAGGPDEARPPAPPPRMSKGAIGAVGQSIADLKSRAIIEVPADMIDNAGLEDRLDSNPDEIGELAESMRVYGQQVPVLLRHSPNIEGRYEVVFGRRRVAALKRAGLPVKAMLRDLTDRDLVIAQGQENSARKDLSFIEKANFARQMRDGGFARNVICDALSIDKTVVSRMLTVADTIPLPLLHAIGAAPSIGRDRWMALVGRLKGRDPGALLPLARGDNSDTRFEAVFRATTAKPDNTTPPPAPLRAGSAVLGQVSRARGRTVLTLSHKASPGFDEWLVQNFEKIHQRFLNSRGE